MFKKLTLVILFTLATGLFNSSFAQTDGAMMTINVNVATAEQIADILDGVGMTRAQAIVQHRENYGKFERVEELLMVRGIGDSILNANREKIALE
ncbi:MAG: ComEA family DNA-binding protein [Porticoccaceae bacterium]|jgi:competence protein ComEA|nr:ComEA family DNA-binding protein [Porticoccaceae bacterium]